MKKKSFIKWVRGKNQLIVSNEKALLGDFKNIKSGHATDKTFSYFDYPMYNKERITHIRRSGIY